MEALAQLENAEAQAALLFRMIESEQLIRAGETEKSLNEAVYRLAEKHLGITKYWHKRIVRSGANTLLPYRENPPNLIIREDDILFFDFGPVFEDWEADFGRTYVLGNDPHKLKLQGDTEKAWTLGKAYYEAHKAVITAAELYRYIEQLARDMGWEYGNEHCGHLVGNFPHEQIIGDERQYYLHPENNRLLSAPAENGNPLYWILEIHFVDRERQIGAFFEQLLS
jgi:Xaa-Pro aminopeptidase